MIIAPGDVVELAPDTFKHARRADTLLGKAGVHTHVGPKEADVDAALATGLINPRVRKRDAHFGPAYVWPCRHR